MNTTTTPSIKLGPVERFFSCLLDDWIAPCLPAIPDVPCWTPRITERGVAIDTPGVTQVNTYTCGATASWSVLRGMGWDIELSDWLATCHAHGLSRYAGMDAAQMDSALHAVGARLVTRKFENCRQVKRLIEAGRPVLFGWDDEMFDDGDHWLYAYGYEKNRVLVGNEIRPGRSKRSVSWCEWRDRLTPHALYVIEKIC